ncbi:MAG: Rrf2 family transcriptional regulator [Candidatus Krumholzibacteria bacterium]|nr:Rrf2 family transcriptional regulator [Candidatus Krumholzibacteria bacterium]
MSSFIKFSEAVSLAFHTAAYLARHPERLVSSREIARSLGASENHLSKVLQRLARSGIVHSTRGPNGGFRLRSPWEKMKLVEIYEAIEGPLAPGRCLLALPVCKGNRCSLGAVLHKTDEAVRKCLTGTTLAELTRSFRPEA